MGNTAISDSNGHASADDNGDELFISVADESPLLTYFYELREDMSELSLRRRRLARQRRPTYGQAIPWGTINSQQSQNYDEFEIVEELIGMLQSAGAMEVFDQALRTAPNPQATFQDFLAEFRNFIFLDERPYITFIYD